MTATKDIDLSSFKVGRTSFQSGGRLVKYHQKFSDLLVPTQRLLKLLARAIGINKMKSYYLYDYIIQYNDFLGSAQDMLEMMARRLSFSLSYNRYDDDKEKPFDEGITIREVLYYEFWYYLYYVLPNQNKYKIPDVITILGMSMDQFKVLYKKMYTNGEYDKNEYEHRLSLVTDYVQMKESGKLQRGSFVKKEHIHHK